MNALQQEIMRCRSRIQIIGREAQGELDDTRTGTLILKLTDEIANLAWLAAEAAKHYPPATQGEGESS